MKIIKTLLLALLVSTGAQAADPARLEFKDIYIGQQAKELEGNPNRFTCKESAASDQMCHLRIGIIETIAGVPSNAVMAFIHDGVVHQILVQFHPRQFLTVGHALKEKYGTPTVTSTDIVSGTGAHYKNNIWKWKLPDGTLTVEQYASRLDSTYAFFESNDFPRLTASWAKKRAKKGSTDL